MSNRHDLIARKNEVRARIERLRREVAHEQAKGEKANGRKLRRMQGQLEQLMAEEYNLRVAIDQSR